MTGVAHKVTRDLKRELADAIRRDETLTPATKLVGEYIADKLNKKRGYAWPSADTIAADLSISRSTVLRAIGVLAERHFSVTRQRGLANEYRPTGVKMTLVDRCQNATGGVSNCDGTGANLTPQLLRNARKKRSTSDERKKLRIDDIPTYLDQCETERNTLPPIDRSHLVDLLKDRRVILNREWRGRIETLLGSVPP